MSRLKINLEAIERETNPNAEGFSADGRVRVGSLLVSSEGVRDSAGHYYELSLNDFDVVPEAEGGFLGRGSSGSVRRAIHRRSNTVVALKEIKVTGKAHMSEIRRELETLHAGDSTTPYLVNFYGAFTHEGSVFIAMEAMDGSLQEIAKPVPLPVLACITRQMLKGLFYLHRTRHLMHRDLKPNNVLFNSRTGDIKISDFGVSSFLECTKADAHSFVGTVTYMSPERLHGDSYSYGADIWSLGLVVAELALGICPFAGLRGESSEGRFWALIQHLNGTGPALELPAEMDRSLADFINACVVKEPDQRATCSDLLHHPFIQKCTPSATTPVSSPPAAATGTVTATATAESAKDVFLAPPSAASAALTSSTASRSPVLAFPTTRSFDGFAGTAGCGAASSAASPPTSSPQQEHCEGEMMAGRTALTTASSSSGCVRRRSSGRSTTAVLNAAPTGPHRPTSTTTTSITISINQPARVQRVRRRSAMWRRAARRTRAARTLTRSTPPPPPPPHPKGRRTAPRRVTSAGRVTAAAPACHATRRRGSGPPSTRCAAAGNRR